MIFVVGNETARQGPAEFDYVRTAGESAGKGIVVNAIYCGDTDYAAATPTWKEMSRIGMGRYMEIAAAVGGAVVAAQRATAKSTSLYDNARWDLVDASRRPEFKWEDVDEAELPAELRSLSVGQRKEYVEEKSAERAKIRDKIKDLSAKREAAVREEIRTRGLDTQKAFDENVRRAIIDQATAKGFRFDG